MTTGVTAAAASTAGATAASAASTAVVLVAGAALVAALGAAVVVAGGVVAALGVVFGGPTTLESSPICHATTPPPPSSTTRSTPMSAPLPPFFLLEPSRSSLRRRELGGETAGDGIDFGAGESMISGCEGEPARTVEASAGSAPSGEAGTDPVPIGDAMIIVSPDCSAFTAPGFALGATSPVWKRGFCPISSSEPPASLSASSRSSAACFITV